MESASRARTTGWWGVVIEAPDARRLARFYAELLGWTVASDDPAFATITQPGTTSYLAFNTSAEYVPPRWPPVAGSQQMMMHVDVGVQELASAVDIALGLGAALAEHQPQDDVRVLLDPAGHPFCLYVDGD